VTRIGKDTVLAGIVRAVEEAQGAKPRIQAVADRVVGVFVPAMLVLAVGTVAFWLARGAPAAEAIMTGISVVVIACPCALGLATPIAVIVAAGLATSRGLLLRGGDVLERAARATDVLLDKTGTVTRGRPTLREVVPIDPALSADAALALAAAVEMRSEHHVGRAIAAAARLLPSVPELEVTDFRAVAGRGVAATVTAAPTSTSTSPVESTAVHPEPFDFGAEGASAQGRLRAPAHPERSGGEAPAESKGAEAAARSRRAPTSTATSTATPTSTATFSGVADMPVPVGPEPEWAEAPAPATAEERAARRRRLAAPLESLLPRIHPATRAQLEERGRLTVEQALEFWPRAYQDRTQLRRVADLRPGDEGIVLATVSAVRTQRMRSGRPMLKVAAADASADRSRLLQRATLAPEAVPEG